MGVQRYISASFWDDSYIQSLDPSEKLLYMYLLTNPLTNIAGVYKITVRRMSFDTGFTPEVVSAILDKFAGDRKIFTVDEYVVIRSWARHQKWEKSPKIRDGIISILRDLPKNVFDFLDGCGYTFDLSLAGTPAKKVLEKANGKCARCGGTEDPAVCHIKPVEDGGDNSAGNLQVLCAGCRTENGARSSIDTLSILKSQSRYPMNYLNSNLNSNLNSDTNSDTNSNSDLQSESEESGVCAEAPCDSPGISGAQKEYARRIYDVWVKADLPRPKSGFNAFLLGDFYNALADLHRQRLHSDDVISAAENYAEVTELAKSGMSWWSSRSTFDNFVRPSVIRRFLPDYYSRDIFLKQNIPKGAAVSRSGCDTVVEVGF